MRLAFGLLCLVALLHAEIIIDGQLANSKPQMYNITLTDQDSGLPGAQISTPPPVTVEINATAKDLNGYNDMLPASSSCTWRSGDYVIVTPLTFSDCQNTSCQVSCGKVFNASADPSGTYIITLAVADHTESAAINLTLEHNRLPESPEEGGDKLKAMRISTTSICPGNILKVLVSESDGEPLEGVRLYLWQGLYVNAGEARSDEDGLAYFSIGETGEYLMVAHKKDYRSYRGSFSLSTCPPVQPPALPPLPGCKIDDDCAYYERCENETCRNITGLCGYPANHAWVSYDCCSDSDCGPMQRCANNGCLNRTYELLAPPKAIAGSEVDVNAIIDTKRFINATIRVDTPDGIQYFLITDSDGLAIFRPALAGNYTLSLLDGGLIVKSAVIESIPLTQPSAPPEGVPTAAEEPFPCLLALLVLLLVIAAYHILDRHILKRKKGLRKGK